MLACETALLCYASADASPASLDDVEEAPARTNNGKKRARRRRRDASDRDAWSLVTPCAVRYRGAARQDSVRATVLWVRDAATIGGTAQRRRSSVKLPSALVRLDGGPYDGQVFTSLSGAATCASGVQSNGYVCWEAYDDDACEWRTLDEVRADAGGNGWINSDRSAAHLATWLDEREAAATKRTRHADDGDASSSWLNAACRIAMRVRSVTHADVVTALQRYGVADVHKAQLMVADRCLLRAARGNHRGDDKKTAEAAVV